MASKHDYFDLQWILNFLNITLFSPASHPAALSAWLASQPASRVKRMVGQPATHALKTTVENLFTQWLLTPNRWLYKPQLAYCHRIGGNDATSVLLTPIPSYLLYILLIHPSPCHMQRDMPYLLHYRSPLDRLLMETVTFNPLSC